MHSEARACIAPFLLTLQLHNDSSREHSGLGLPSGRIWKQSEVLFRDINAWRNLHICCNGKSALCGVSLAQFIVTRTPPRVQAVPSGLALREPLPPGVPSEAAFVAAYAAARGIPPPPLPSLAFHLALSMFRIAAILAGVGARAAQGNASSARASQVGSFSAGFLSEGLCNFQSWQVFRPFDRRAVTQRRSP